MFKDLDFFEEVFGSLPRKTTKDVQLLVDEKADLNDILKSMSARFLEKLSLLN